MTLEKNKVIFEKICTMLALIKSNGGHGEIILKIFQGELQNIQTKISQNIIPHKKG